MRTAIVIDCKEGSFADSYGLILERMGLDARIADIESAYTFLRKDIDIELVVLDAGTDIKECLRRLKMIRSIRPGVRVLVCAFAIKGYRSRLRFAGADAVVEKPFAMSKFKAAAFKLLAR